VTVFSKRDRESTRLICAAVSGDGSLYERVLWEAKHSSPRALPPDTGVDMVAVTGWAMLERRRRTARSILLVVCFVLFLIGLIGLFTGGGFGLAILMPVSLFVSWLVVLGFAIVTDEQLLKFLDREHFDPERITRLLPSDAIRALGQLYQQSDIVVHSGYSPFVGAGKVVQAWSFSVDVARGVDDVAPEEFTADELRKFVVLGLGELRWPELGISERLFVNGLDLERGGPLLPSPLSRPVLAVGPGMVEALAGDAEGRRRRYTEVRIAGWGGTLVYTMYLRFVLRPRSLFVESSSAVLTPVRDSLDLPEQLAVMSGGERVWHSLGWASRRTIPLLARSVGDLVGILAAPIAAERRAQREQRMIGKGLPFDYGAPTTVREMLADPRYPRYFQQLDKEMYAKVVEARVLDLVVEFLDDKGVDTRDLVTRQSTILNNGVMVAAGASLTSENIAVGDSASVTDQRRGSFARAAARTMAAAAGGGGGASER
jgi:hypothetical protein